MDSETMEPIDVEVKKLFETNSMVEEFMLQANISVAEKILQDFPDCAMLRRHPQPPPSNFEPLIKAGKHLVSFYLEKQNISLKFLSYFCSRALKSTQTQERTLQPL